MAGGKFIMMIVMRHKNKIFQMYEFDMRHVDGGKQQVFYDVGLLIYEKEKKICSLTCGKWQAACGKFIMMIVMRHKNKIFQMYEFDMRHVDGGKQQVFYDVGLLIYEKERKYAV